MSEKDGLTKKPRILIVCNYYLPGYKSGGGLRTIVNMVERFHDRFDFYVIARDNDCDGIPYTSVKVNSWNDVSGAQVYYLSKDNVNISKIRELILKVKPNSIYLNSVFSTLTIFLLILRKTRMIPLVKTILAPEGELSEGALKIKSYKKKPFAALAKTANLYRDLIWKTTADLEKAETERFKGSGGEIFIAPNMPSAHLLKTYKPELKPSKRTGEAKMIFLSRISPKKNLKWLVDVLQNFENRLLIDIYGPLEDQDYWTETETSIAKLPEHIRIEYRGLLEYEKVSEKLIEYHFFILPTLGENFGHVFVEAMAAGCPLIISNRTPWLDLKEKSVGWDLPLEKPEKWMEILNDCVNLDALTYEQMSRAAREFAVRWLSDPKIEEDTLRVLQKSLTDD